MDSSNNDIVQSLLEKLLLAERTAEKRLYSDKVLIRDSANDSIVPNHEESQTQSSCYHICHFLLFDLVPYIIKLIVIAWCLFFLIEISREFLDVIISFMKNFVESYFLRNRFSIE
ncbi:MAG: hypothetical protein C0631_16595 [Sedimenticola sp.]|nr:MAG: hypothetical protein C0631_16595 [Sedimenticola sp.]